MIPPEAVALAGAFLWLSAALATGIFRGRVPSEFPMLFSIIAAIGAAIGVSEWVPESIDVWLTLGAVTLYALTPILFTAWLFHRFDPQNRSEENPRTVSD